MLFFCENVCLVRVYFCVCWICMFVKAFIMESEVKDSFRMYKVCSVCCLHTHTHTHSVNKHSDTHTKYSHHFPSEQTFSGSSTQSHSFTYTHVNVHSIHVCTCPHRTAASGDTCASHSRIGQEH